MHFFKIIAEFETLQPCMKMIETFSRFAIVFLHDKRNGIRHLSPEMECTNS